MFRKVGPMTIRVNSQPSEIVEEQGRIHAKKAGCTLCSPLFDLDKKACSAALSRAELQP